MEWRIEMKYKKIIYIFFISLFIVGCQSEVSKANSVEDIGCVQIGKGNERKEQLAKS